MVSSSRTPGNRPTSTDPQGQITEKTVHLLIQVLERHIGRTGLCSDDQVTARWEETLLGAGQLAEPPLYLVSGYGIAHALGYGKTHATTVLNQLVTGCLIVPSRR